MSAIDPGLDDGLENAGNQHGGTNKTDQDDADFMAPGKWWFASTLCPLLGATFGPIANGFSICALVYKWRSFLPPSVSEVDGIPIQDPAWLLAVNAVSLVCALIGNGALLLNMAKRIRFSIAQPITIAGYFLAGILLIADMAAISSSPSYFITEPPEAIPSANHALTSAFYYAIWAAGIYIIVASLMFFTVYGARKGHYKSGFNLTTPQRTLMVQTMMFIGYELLGALVFSSLEGWKYLDGVYWSQVTLLTIGLGDYSPTTRIAQGLLFPFAIGGILMVGLVVGSIRTLVLERGKEKIFARLTEKRRESAVHNVDERKQTIKVSWFSRAHFSTDPSLTPAQRREDEFHVMRKVQKVAERERQYVALTMSLSFALLLWFGGAAIFMACEQHEQGWTYFDSLYFSFVALMTIGYGDLTPTSNAGKAFFVLWSLLAIPSLTILISNLGDTFVKWFSDISQLVASFTILPEKQREEGGTEKDKEANSALGRFTDRANDIVSRFTAPGILGEASGRARVDGQAHYEAILDRLATRLEAHFEQEELNAALKAEAEGHDDSRDVHFYHYVLSRELRNVQRDALTSPPKQYEWHDWEYYLKLMGSGDEGAEEYPDEELLVPEVMQQPGGHDGAVDRATETKNAYAWRGPKKDPKRSNTIDMLDDWSWLSEESPLMSEKSESEWIIERLSTVLVRELDQQRKGVNRRPPITMRHVLRANEIRKKAEQAE